MSKEAKKNETKKDEKKPGLLKRAASWTWHTLADDGIENHDDRDLFQVIADTVMGPTPGRKAARSATAVGAGTAVAGIVSGSVTTLTIGGITFIVGGVAEGIQWYRGRHQDDEDVVDAPTPQLEEPSDVETIENVGANEAGKAASEAKSNLYAVLKDVAVSKFKMTEAKWNQLWSQAQAHEKKGQKFSGAKKQRYLDVVNVAQALGLVQTKPAAAS